MFLPIEFENRMRNLLGEEYEAFAKAFLEGDEAKGLRFSLCRLAGTQGSPDREKGMASREVIEETIKSKYCNSLGERIPWSQEGYYICSTERPGKNLYHEAGAYYLQEPSAMVVATLADVKPGEKVLDLCAAPGGKSTALGDMLCGEGVLVSNEIHPARVKILSENIERMGIPNALVLNETPEKIASLFPEFFDCVVVDAPCSGEGMFRKEEAALREWSPENVEMCAARQNEILREAVKCVALGGRLVYSTCTFAPAEDEENIAWLLSEFPEFSLREIPVELSKVLSEGRPDFVRSAVDTSGKSVLKNCVRIWPHRQRGEGHFAAVLERASESIIPEEDSIGLNDVAEVEITESKKKSKKDKSSQKYDRSKNIALSREQRESFEAFAKEAFTEEGRKRFTEVTTYSPDDERVAALFGDNLYIMPFYFPGKGVRIERAGLHVGTFAKNRFEPSLALSRVLKKNDVKNVLDLSTEEKDKALAYVRGEQLSGIPADLKGWTLVMYDGYGLGFGKASGGVLKNHYPKGLRKDLR